MIAGIAVVQWNEGMLKYLRIAASVLSLTACMLLVGLWVRSFYFYDRVTVPITTIKRASFHSVDGRLHVSGPWHGGGATHWAIRLGQPVRISDTVAQDVRPPLRETLLFSAYREHPIIGVYIPYWFPVLLAGGLSVGLALNWSFSLRTLLIATTLVAVVIGVVVAAR